MKKVLLLAWYFPPRNNIASYRSGCFSKFLPENDWLPTVVCEDWPTGRPDHDPDFVGVIPESVKIHRILNPTPRGFRERFVWRKLGPYLWPSQLPIPWWNQAYALIHELLKKQSFDVIWATAPSLTPLALASTISKETGIPWVADIRDSVNVMKISSWYKRPIFASLERRLCREANRTVTVSQTIANGLGSRIGKKVDVIHNGFDTTLLPSAAEEPSPRFTLVYAGTLVLPQASPQPLIQALQLCIDRKLIPSAEVEVLFYGSDPRDLALACPNLNGLPVRTMPKVSHKEILRVLMSSSVQLLLSHSAEKGVLTGKVFDYLATGRPILAVPDDRGEISSLLKQTGAGVALTQVEDIARLLSQWFALWKAGDNDHHRSARHEAEIARYSRREQTKQLAAIFDEVSSPRAANHSVLRTS